MADKAALITGGSSGIGLAVARALGEDGYGITVSARRPDKLEAAAAELREAGLDVHAIAANMTDEDDIKRMVAEHVERFGRLDFLMNNAGLGIGGAIAEVETKKLDMQIAVNLRAVYLVTREAIPLLKQAGANGGAMIVNTASIAGKQPQGWLAAYSATKAAVIALTEATAKEIANDGVRCTSICPGFVDTRDDRVDPRPGRAGRHDPARGRRRGGALPAAPLARLHDPRGDDDPARGPAVRADSLAVASKDVVQATECASRAQARAWKTGWVREEGSPASATGLGGGVSRDLQRKVAVTRESAPGCATAAELSQSPCVKAGARRESSSTGACRSTHLIRIARRRLIPNRCVRLASQTTRRASLCASRSCPYPTPVFEPATSARPATTCVGTTPSN